MKRVLIYSLLLLPVLLSFNKDKGTKLKVLTLNIRYDNPIDVPNDWPSRKDFVLSFIESEEPDIFGLQEALWHQYYFLDSALTGYKSIGAGREDGRFKGEMTPVFYCKDRFQAINLGTFWLSETPDIPGSKGWGAVLPRIVTWVELYDKSSQVTFFFFNTHYSHMSDSARLMSSRIILEEVKKIAGNYPFILTGDFNMLPDSEAYATLTEEGKVEAFIIESYLITETEPAGLAYTFNGFKNKEREGRIDYIFVSSNTRVLSHETKSPRQGRLFLSDHWPVMATVILSSCNTPKDDDQK